MSISELCNGSDGIEPGILAEGVGNDFHRLGECLEAVCVRPCEGVCVKHELSGDLSLGGSASSNQKSFLHQTTDDTECVMKRSKCVTK